MGLVSPPKAHCSSLNLQLFLSSLWWQMPPREGHGSGQLLAGLEGGPPQLLHWGISVLESLAVRLSCSPTNFRQHLCLQTQPSYGKSPTDNFQAEATDAASMDVHPGSALWCLKFSTALGGDAPGPFQSFMQSHGAERGILLALDSLLKQVGFPLHKHPGFSTAAAASPTSFHPSLLTHYP